jgi:hypothetical protein
MSVTEILGTIRDGSLQVCASAEGEYDHAAEKISVALDAFTRRASASEDGAHIPQPWLPRGETVREHLPRSEADEFVKDVFHRWVEKVRASVPHDLPLRP